MEIVGMKSKRTESKECGEKKLTELEDRGESEGLMMEEND